MDSHQPGERIADALTRVGEQYEAEDAQRQAEADDLADELYASGYYDRAGANLEAWMTVGQHLAYAAAWDAQPGAPANCPVFAVGDLVEITNPTHSCRGMTGVVVSHSALHGNYFVGLGGGFETALPASALRLSLRRFADVPERVRELARRGPASVEHRYDRTHLGDGSTWRGDAGERVLLSPPDAYRTPEVLTAIAAREAAAAHAEASAEALAIVGLLGERGHEPAKPTPGDEPVFRCAGCGKVARLLIADARGVVWCRACLPGDGDDPPPAGVAIPVPLPTPDSDTGAAVAEARCRALWSYEGTAGDLIELIAAERAA